MKSLLHVLAGLLFSSTVLTGGPQLLTEPIIPTDPDAAGRELAAQLRTQQPAAGITNQATLTIRARKGEERSVPLRIELAVTETNWSSTYVEMNNDGADVCRYSLVRQFDGTTVYQVQPGSGCASSAPELRGAAACLPIANSDFWLCDVGMEFLHWPTQRLLRKEIRRTQSCDKLESIAPPGWTGEYTRVLSWFDIDTGGPVVVEAYDAKGRMVKEFKPNDFKKVDGQYQVEEIEMNNLITRSRSTIRFDLKSGAASTQ